MSDPGEASSINMFLPCGGSRGVPVAKCTPEHDVKHLDHEELALAMRFGRISQGARVARNSFRCLFHDIGWKGLIGDSADSLPTLMWHCETVERYPCWQRQYQIFINSGP